MSETTFLNRLARDDRGTTTIEYSLICGTIFLGLVTAVSGVADENNGLWATVSKKTEAAVSGNS